MSGITQDIMAECWQLVVLSKGIYINYTHISLSRSTSLFFPNVVSCPHYPLCEIVQDAIHFLQEMALRGGQ